LITFSKVTFTYPGAGRPAFQNVSFQIHEGQFVLVTGTSGSGKSSLLRCLNGLVPQFSGGKLEGSLSVFGADPRLTPVSKMSLKVGFVFQDPEAQFVYDRVEDEIAFGLENAAVCPAEMETRVDQVLGLLHLGHLRTRRLETLSGGERQRVAIAAALALRPTLLVLDEPTSQLDAESAEDVLTSLLELNQRLKLTIMLSEHRLERVLPYANFQIHLDANQEGALCNEPRQVLSRIKDLQPPLVRVGKALHWEPLPLSMEEARSFSLEFCPQPLLKPHLDPINASDCLIVKDLTVRFQETDALCGIDLELHRGEVLAVLGPNGAGKSTLLRCLVGLQRPLSGSILLDGEDISQKDVADICRKVGYLPQNPNILLFAESALEEMRITLRNHALPVQEAEITALLARLGITHLKDRYPRDLSTGERQRVALGAVTITQPPVLLLDEPTRGLDYLAKEQLASLLRDWKTDGTGIILVTHDVELAACVADRVLVLNQGKVEALGGPKDVFSGSGRYSTQVARLFPGREWISPEDVLLALPK
jgi:energy-coupling factor transport system ATP-binding protein